ncbi:MAG: 2,3-bisphosphoglycerate-independent phosphoglycerate mutase [Pirellulaceae bacterium]|nr:2,3-bisphosphoglycerate-independent phosphoglycerate mutase [Pirellulaceae bacterium]
MDIQDLTKLLHTQNSSKIVMMVADGIGGLPLEPGGKTELETAQTPNLDQLAQKGVSGLSIPVAPGITPGSGPGHLALFGYDPIQHPIGRGALEATGVGLELGNNDVAIRCNFCTLDSKRNILDRRAGRIASETSFKIVKRLQEIKIPGITIFVEPVKEHRFVVLFRGDGLGGDVDDTDPQQIGVPPLETKAHNECSKKTAAVAAQFIQQAEALLKDEEQANGLTMRGFSKRPNLPSYEEAYGLRAAAIAVYPMYKGLAQLAGMKIVGNAKTLEEQVAVLKDVWNDFDFFFLHFKYTDSTGEDGNFAEKVKRIEEFDQIIPQVSALSPDCLIITGDHSTPAYLKQHSWHPVPTLLVSDCCRTDRCKTFGENEALMGGLGQFKAKYLMALALANAGRLGKYGA